MVEDKYLNKNGLAYFWEKINKKFASKQDLETSYQSHKAELKGQDGKDGAPGKCHYKVWKVAWTGVTQKVGEKLCTLPEEWDEIALCGGFNNNKTFVCSEIFPKVLFDMTNTVDGDKIFYANNVNFRIKPNGDVLLEQIFNDAHAAAVLYSVWTTDPPEEDDK